MPMYMVLSFSYGIMDHVIKYIILVSVSTSECECTKAGHFMGQWRYSLSQKVHHAN